MPPSCGEIHPGNEAAELLRLTPADLLKFGIIDDVITEPIGGAHRSEPWGSRCGLLYAVT